MKFQKLFAALALSFAVIACSKEQAAPEEEVINPQEPQTEQSDVPEGYVRLTFSTPAETKTSIDKESGAVSWSEHDRIKICWDGGNATSDEVVISEGIARFTANVSAAAEDLYAVYPAGITASVASGTLSVDIPQSQTGRFADADIIVAKTTKTALTYAFHHAVSLVRFVISDGNTRGITRARFVDKGHSSQLYGTLGITFDASNAIATNDLVENLDNDVIDITAVQEGDNFIAVPPTKSLVGYGLRMGTSSTWLPGIVGEKAYDFSASGARLALGTVDAKINDGNWYITPDGAGTKDGKSWENAGDAAMLWNLIHVWSESAAGKKNLARGWRIDGKTIYVSEGVYDSPLDAGFICSFDGYTDDDDDVVTFTLEGGFTTAGVASNTARTVFGSDASESPLEKHGFFFYTGTKATLKNLFINNHSTSDKGPAVGCRGASDVSLVNCHLEGNVSTDQAGAMYITGSSKVNLTNCDFVNNKATAGGAFRLDSGASLSITGGSFVSNSASGNGGAIFTADKINISSCTFDGNIASTDGGAIYTATNSELRADKCKFINNSYNISANQKSATVRLGSNAYFNACEFRDNKSKNAQSTKVFYNATATTVTGFNNCLFYNNESSAGNWVIYSKGPVYMVNTTMIDQAGNAVLGADNASSVCYNSIFINTTSEKSGLRGVASTTHNYNIVNAFLTVTQNEKEVVASELGDGDGSHMYSTHAAGVTAGVASGMSYYSWNGTTPVFEQTTKADVISKIQGTDFYAWLDELVGTTGDDKTALDYDIRGKERSSGYWPGSYQN